MNHLKKKYVRLERKNRLYGLPCPLVGLTGGLCSGKSTVAAFLRKRGIFVICADQLVKGLYQTQKARDFLEAHFPESVAKGTVDFGHLREIVFSLPEKRKKIEDFIHPLLANEFEKEARVPLKQNQGFIVYDVPLLFEKNLEGQFDHIICVVAPGKVQLKRLLARDKIGEDLATQMLATQMPLQDKMSLAHSVLMNESTLEDLEIRVVQLLGNLVTGGRLEERVP